uniref:Transmembrane protein n=1 Tax=Rhizophora mucronata TaxID=61149 RepID=A0A2P2LZG6_RHIMU
MNRERNVDVKDSRMEEAGSPRALNLTPRQGKSLASIFHFVLFFFNFSGDSCPIFVFLLPFVLMCGDLRLRVRFKRTW